MTLIPIRIRFYAELNDLLPHRLRGRECDHLVEDTTSVKHDVEALGVPHTEIDLILVNGQPVTFEERLKAGDRVSVYPVFEALDIQPLTRLRPAPLRQPRFILDTHLGRLAAYLRMLGFDCLYNNHAEDAELAQVSAAEHRILLTRDRGLLKRGVVTHGYCVRVDAPRQQVREVLERFDLRSQVMPFTRCMHCNESLAPVAKQQIAHLVPPLSRQYYDEFKQCPGCLRIFWKGSHYQRMQAWIEELIHRTTASGSEGCSL